MISSIGFHRREGRLVTTTQSHATTTDSAQGNRVRVISFYAAPEYRLVPTGEVKPNPPVKWLDQEFAKLLQTGPSARLVRLPQLERQLPERVWTEQFTPGDVQINPDPQLRDSAGVAEDMRVPFSDVTSYLFVLQVPVRQAVMAFEFGLDLSDGDVVSKLHTLMRYLAAAELEVRSPRTGMHLTLTQYVQQAIRDAGWERGADDKTPKGDEYWLALERHQMVLIDNWSTVRPDGAVADERESEALKRAIMHQLSGDPQSLADLVAFEQRETLDHQFSGGQIHLPVALNLRSGHWCGVLASTSMIIGEHSDALLAGLCLTVVQAVGTGARFQTIWNRAFDYASRFQRSYKDEPLGARPRKALEELSDELGNLEFELAFNVGTAADLGLRIPSDPARADDFHHAVYEAMELRQRVATVGQMFIQARNSVGSELTAIESRETRLAAQRSGVLEFTYSGIGLLLGFLALALAFFGMSTSDLQTCVVTKDGIPDCEPLSMRQAVQLAYNHHWIWLAFAPLVLFVIPPTYRAFTWWRAHRDSGDVSARRSSV
jgi:hypothetical protein